MHRRYLLLYFLALLAALNVACAQNGSPRDAQSANGMLAQEDHGETLEQRVQRVLGKKSAPADSGLDQDLFYKFLIAEIAGQRGDIALATRTYFELARGTRDPRVARRATEVALYAKDDAVALQTAKIWYEREPESADARRTLADLLIRSGDLRAAKPLLSEMLANAADETPQTLMHLYDMCAGSPDAGAVNRLLRDLTAPYLGMPEAHYVMARAAYADGDRQRALQSVEQALKLRPSWQQGALLKSRLLAEEDRVAAAAFMRDFVRQYPDAHDVRLTYARVLISERQFDEARAQFQVLVAANPANASLAFTLGLLSAQMDDFAAADEQFRKALSLGHSDPDAIYYQLGQVNEKLQREDDARRWYGKVQGGEQYVAAQARYAQLVARSGGVDQARLYLQSLEAADDEQRVQLIQAEAHMLREVREYQQSFDVLQNALEARPENQALLYDLALAAERIDRLDVVESHLLKLIELNPDSAQAYNALGYTLADRTDRYREARKYVAKALELAPDDPFILDSMGWVEYRLGKIDACIRYLRRAYEMQPDPEIAAHLGEALWAKGEKEEAERIWSETASRYPENDVLQKVMQKFLAR